MAETTDPKTLRAAHDLATRTRPGVGANDAAWLTFHQRNARMYEAVSDVDRWHHHEALYWAGYEQRKAGEVAARIQQGKRSGD